MNVYLQVKQRQFQSREAREFAVAWNDLWPINRRRTLGTYFVVITWHWKPDRMDVLLRVAP